MSKHPQTYQLPHSIDTRDLILRLQEGFKINKIKTKRQVARYFDTFDWRIYKAGSVLFSEKYYRGYILFLSDLIDRSVWYLTPTRQLPRFAHELLPGPFKEKVSSIIEPRALMPLVEVQRQVHTMRLQSKKNKTLARITIAEPGMAHDVISGRRSTSVGNIHIEPIKGQAKTMSRLITFLREDLELQSSKPELPSLLSIFGRIPGSYSPRFLLKIDPTERTDISVQRVLLKLLRNMQANEAGLLADIDTEFLHQYRVAVRRTRSILGQFKHIFPSTVLMRFRNAFKWLGSITGPTRDLDVYCLRIKDYKNNLPKRIRRDLDPLGDFLERRQREAHRKMVNAFGSNRYTSFIRSWETFLTTPVPDIPATQLAGEPIYSVARSHTWRLYKRVRSKGRSIHKGTNAEVYHRLRIDCKKLRYMMQIFSNLYPFEDIDVCIQALKNLQNVLGDIQDFEVQQTRLQGFARDMMAEGQTSADTITAIGRLEAHLEDLNQKAKAAFADSFARFNRPEIHQRFVSLFDDTADSGYY